MSTPIVWGNDILVAPVPTPTQYPHTSTLGDGGVVVVWDGSVTLNNGSTAHLILTQPPLAASHSSFNFW